MMGGAQASHFLCAGRHKAKGSLRPAFCQGMSQHHYDYDRRSIIVRSRRVVLRIQVGDKKDFIVRFSGNRPIPVLQPADPAKR